MTKYDRDYISNETEVARLKDIRSFLEKADYGANLYERTWPSPYCWDALQEALRECFDDIDGMIKERTKQFQIVGIATEFHSTYEAGHEQECGTYDTLARAQEELGQYRDRDKGYASMWPIGQEGWNFIIREVN